MVDPYKLLKFSEKKIRGNLAMTSTIAPKMVINCFSTPAIQLPLAVLFVHANKTLQEFLSPFKPSFAHAKESMDEATEGV